LLGSLAQRFMHATAPTEPSRTPTRRPGQWRFSAAQLLVALVLLIVVSPFAADFPGGREVEGGLLTVALLAGVFAVGGNRTTLVFAMLLVSPALIGKWIHHFRPDWVPNWVVIFSALVFGAFVIVHLLRFVLRAPRVNGEVLCASISAYLMLGMVWAFAYMLVWSVNPHAFAFSVSGTTAQPMDRDDAFYFSFVTLSTVGYGDIVPVSHAARMLAVVEAMTGLLYVAVLIARLVSMYSAHSPQREKLD
jgi:hypothetical protein